MEKMGAECELHDGGLVRCDPGYAIAVGRPGTRPPPHRSRRAVCPHRALQACARPQSRLGTPGGRKTAAGSISSTSIRRPARRRPATVGGSGGAGTCTRAVTHLWRTSPGCSIRCFGVGQLLQPVLYVGPVFDVPASGPDTDPMGAAEVQASTGSPATCSPLAAPSGERAAAAAA